MDKELDPEQQEAVSYSGGPLRVEAGPGTGKTTVIVNRVLKMVRDGIPQESILCMTFTKKATGEMRRRLYQKKAGRVQVYTMHALSLEILKEEMTEISEGTTIFSEPAKMAWCVRNLDSMGIDTDVIKIGNDPRERCKEMLGLIRLAKLERISADELERYIAEKRQESPDIEENLQQLGEATKAYRAYDEYMKDKDLVDYDDMIIKAIEYLQQNKSALKRFKERYNHVLVDEFQDNNYVQFLFAKILAGTRNITVVGDADQSIMGFQGAFYGIFDEFDAEYEQSRHLALNTTYRLTARIARLSAQILRAEPGRERKVLQCKNDEMEPAVVAVTADEAAEREYVAETILNMKDAPPGKIAVLCSTNKQCNMFAKTLRARGIHTALAGPGLLFRNEAVRQVITLLKIADSPDASGIEIGFALKRRGIHEYNIRRIRKAAKALPKGGNGVDDDGTFAALKEFSGSDQDVEIREIVHWLEKIIRDARSSGLLGILHRIMGKYSDAYRSNASAKGYREISNLDALNRLYGMAEDYYLHYGDRGISDFIKYLEIIDDIDLSDPDSDYDESGDMVSVMTIHKSKGKEFDTVFVTGLYDGGIPDNSKKKKKKFEIPEELYKRRQRTHYTQKDRLYEQRNLLYVAMTRAKKRLYMTYPKRAKTSTTEREPSRFLAEIAYDKNTDIKVIEYEQAPKSEFIEDPLEGEKRRIQEETCTAILESRSDAAIRGMVKIAAISHIQKGGDPESFQPRTALKANLDGIRPPPVPKIPLVNKDNFTLAATSIQTYEKCPLQFKYSNILRMPEKPAIYLKKGSVIHRALERIGEARKDGRDPDLEEIKRSMREELASHRALFDEREYENTESSLDDIMDNYSEWERNSPNKVEGVEVNHSTRIEGIEYKGTMDRIEVNPDGGYEIIDFKVSKNPAPYKDLEKNVQMNMYAYFVKEKYGSLPAKVTLAYPGDKKVKLREYRITEESLEAGMNIIKEYARKILNEEFEPTPEYMACKTCSYKEYCPDAMI